MFSFSFPVLYRLIARMIALIERTTNAKLTKKSTHTSTEENTQMCKQQPLLFCSDQCCNIIIFGEKTPHKTTPRRWHNWATYGYYECGSMAITSVLRKITSSCSPSLALFVWLAYYTTKMILSFLQNPLFPCTFCTPSPSSPMPGQQWVICGSCHAWDTVIMSQ